jgi:glycosyltransferase involved in cell wall biosynthesis
MNGHDKLQALPARDDVWVVVPAYNEAKVIGDTIRDVRSAGYSHVLVVDDGSRDGTSAAARAAGAIALRHAVNLGQGAALQTGITFARRHGAAAVCTFDADGQHDPASIDRMREAIAGGYDVILGSRFLGGDQDAVPPLRRAVLRLAVIFTRLHSRLDVTDTHNGLRLLGPRALDAIEIQHPGMAHASEILQQISAHKLAWFEIPTRIRYTEYSKHKGQRSSNSFRILFELFYDGLTRR